MILSPGRLLRCHCVEVITVAARTLDLLADLVARGRATITTAKPHMPSASPMTRYACGCTALCSRVAHAGEEVQALLVRN